MKIGPLQFYRYNSFSGYYNHLFEIQIQRFGKTEFMKKRWGSGLCFGIVIFDYHFYMDLMLTLPTEGESD